MAYVKLIFVNSDVPIGYQTINQGRDNLDAVFAGLDAEHIASNAEAGNLVIGQHDLQAIPRDVIQVYGASVSVVGRTAYVSTTPGTFSNGTSLYLSTGTYFVPLFGLKTYWGEAIASVSSSTSAPHLICRSVYPSKPTTSGALGPGIVITCYEMSSGTSTLTDFDFTLTVYGER